MKSDRPALPLGAAIIPSTPCVRVPAEELIRIACIQIVWASKIRMAFA